MADMDAFVENCDERLPFLIRESIDDGLNKSRFSDIKYFLFNKKTYLHILLIISYTLISFVVILSFHQPISQRRHNALQDINIYYEPRKYSFMRDSPYIGPPSDDVDTAWNKLFNSMSVRVSVSELSYNNQESVPLPKGGHLAWLGVYHELHCVKVLRQANYRDFYHPNITVEELRDLQVHADHCVDLLREALMCHGDTESLTTFIWSEKWTKPLLSPRRPYHRCMNWDILVESLKGRIVDEEEMNSLKNPRLTV